MTDCLVSNADMNVPSSLVADILPPGYQSSTDPIGRIFLDIGSCGKISLDGVDVGSASFWNVGVLVKHPEKAPAAGQRSSVFLVEMGTNNSAFRDWLKARGVPPIEGSTIVTVASQSPLFISTVSGKVHVGGMETYVSESFAERAGVRGKQNEIWFFGLDPKKDFWEMQHAMTYSLEDGPGTVRAAPNTALAKSAKGVIEWQTISSWQRTEFRTLSAPSS